MYDVSAIAYQTRAELPLTTFHHLQTVENKNKIVQRDTITFLNNSLRFRYCRLYLHFNVAHFGHAFLFIHSRCMTYTANGRNLSTLKLRMNATHLRRRPISTYYNWDMPFYFIAEGNRFEKGFFTSLLRVLTLKVSGSMLKNIIIIFF